MRELILCYTPADEGAARRLGDFLEANLAIRVSYSDGLLRPGFDIVDAAETGLSAEISLVLLSPESMPKAWSRDKWYPVFFQKPDEYGSRAGFVLLRECRFPEVIRKGRPFFDLSGDFLEGARRIKHWAMRPDGALLRGAELPSGVRALRERIGDRPGLVADLGLDAALEFAAACEADFEAIHRFDCRRRTRTGIVGHIAWTLGLQASGTAEENRASVARFFGERRVLAIFENLAEKDRDLVDFGGLMSAIFTGPEALPRQASAEELIAAFCAFARDDERCAALLGDAVAAAGETPRIGWGAVGFLKAKSRFAEAVEMLDIMREAAVARGAAEGLAKIEWEQSWLRDVGSDGGVVRILDTAGPAVAQLALDFG